MHNPETPYQIQIGPHTYHINTHQPDLDRETLKDSTHPNLGLCDPTTLTIYMTVHQAPSQQQDTLLHETLHALFSLIGAGEDIDHDTEEKLVRRLAPALLQTLQNNPQLVHYLTTQH